MSLGAVAVSPNGAGYRPHRLPGDRTGLLGGLSGVASVTRRWRDQEIARPERGYEPWQQIVRGAARQCAARIDGRRQIIDFILPGDVFLPATDHEGIAVEAITDDTVVASFPKREIEQLEDPGPSPGREFHDLALAGAHRLRRQVLILGRASAVGKVSAFLLDMADRLPVDGRGRFTLPMSRYDIADYLIMSVETVSRSLTRLNSRGAVEFSSGRGVRIAHRAVLEGEEGGVH